MFADGGVHRQRQANMALFAFAEMIQFQEVNVSCHILDHR